MRLGDFVYRSFCACARPRRSTPSNPAASFLHPKENTPCTIHPPAVYHRPRALPESLSHSPCLHRVQWASRPPSHSVVIIYIYIHTVLYPTAAPHPTIVISSSFRSKNPSSSSLDTKLTPPSRPLCPHPHPIPTPSILNPYHRSIIYLALFSSPRRPTRLGFRQKMRPFVWELGRLWLTRSHNDAVALFLPKTNGCY